MGSNPSGTSVFLFQLLSALILKQEGLSKLEAGRIQSFYPLPLLCDTADRETLSYGYALLQSDPVSVLTGLSKGL